jgi:hypothetical protein
MFGGVIDDRRASSVIGDSHSDSMYNRCFMVLGLAMNMEMQAENSYRLHKLLEHASALNAGEDNFILTHEDKNNFLAFLREAIERNSRLIDDSHN